MRRMITTTVVGQSPDGRAGQDEAGAASIPAMAMLGTFYRAATGTQLKPATGVITYVIA